MPSGNLLYNFSYLLCQPFWVHSHPQYMNTEQAKQHSCAASNIVDILHSILNQHVKSTCSKMNKQWKQLRKHQQKLFTSAWRDLWWPGPSDKTLLIHITKKWLRCIRKAEVELCDEDGTYYCFRSKKACHY